MYVHEREGLLGRITGDIGDATWTYRVSGASNNFLGSQGCYGLAGVVLGCMVALYESFAESCGAAMELEWFRGGFRA